jgi:hypothetical protein
VVIVEDEATLDEIDEALSHLRLKLEDRYGNRLNWKSKQLYLDSIDDLLDARSEMIKETLDKTIIKV